MKIVVINKNQSSHIPAMKAALCGHDVVWAFDRCNPSVYVEGDKTVKNAIGTGFQAGRTRDEGAKVHGYEEGILFLDGDRVPQGDLPDFSAMGYDAICLYAEDDPRYYMEGVHEATWYGVPFEDPCNYIYTLGIWLSPRAMKVLLEECDGRLFDADFDGKWGEEDRYIGDVLRIRGLTIGFSDEPRLAGKVGSLEPMKGAEFALNFIKRSQKRKLLLDKYGTLNMAGIKETVLELIAKNCSVVHELVAE